MLKLDTKLSFFFLFFSRNLDSRIENREGNEKIPISFIMKSHASSENENLMKDVTAKNFSLYPFYTLFFLTLFLLSASVIFLNTVLCAVFLLYFIFTPFLLVGLLRVSCKFVKEINNPDPPINRPFSINFSIYFLPSSSHAKILLRKSENRLVFVCGLTI